MASTTATTTVSVWAFIDSSPFWSNFFSQLLATFIVVLIGSVMIPPIIRWFKRTKLVFHKSHSNSNRFALSKVADDEFETTMDLSIQNLGSQTVERFYWEMFFPKGISVDIQAKPPYPHYYTTHREEGDRFLRLYGYVEMPIFSLDRIEFVFEVKVKVKEQKRIKVFYFFNSDNGVSPVWTWVATALRKHHWLRSLIIE